MDDLLNMMNKSPEIVRVRGSAVNLAFRRVNKARKQVAMWTEELANAEATLASEEKEFHTILNRWNPETNELEAPETKN